MEVFNTRRRRELHPQTTIAITFYEDFIQHFSKEKLPSEGTLGKNYKLQD